VAADTAAHVVVGDLEALDLDPEDAHHLSSVLRLRPGEAVGATDGRGGYVRCEWSAGRLSAVSEVVVAPPPRPRVTVGFPPVKGDRPEWAVQKLTELGVDRIVLLSSARTVVRWEGPRLVSHLARLSRVARAAVMQSRQVWLPSIEGVLELASFVAGRGAGGQGGEGAGGVAVADAGGGPLGAEVHTVLVGPEGGWSDEERARMVAGPAPVEVLGLGPSVLRTETAAVAAGVLLTARRAGVIG